VDLDACTVNSVRVPSRFENVSPFDCRETFAAAAAGAFFLSLMAFQSRWT